MAHSYTPGLRVAARTRIVKTRRLPLKGQVVVEKGSVVSADEIVARTELPGNVQPVKAASILGVHQQDLESYMLKKVGDPVQEGEVIALAKSFFGLFKSQVKSPVTGTLEVVSGVTGQVILREPPIPLEVDAYIDGTVTEVIPHEGVVVETIGAFVQGIFGIGGESSGILVPVVQSPDQELSPQLLRPEHRDKIVIGGSRVHRESVERARELGIRGIVVAGIDDADLREILGYDLGVAITGHETLGVTVVVTEGFGRMTMAVRTFDLLTRFAGKKASINGATQIRAGVMRPEVIVPIETALSTVEEESPAAGGLQIGSSIRAIRVPYFGQLGEVIELPPELITIESEAKVRILKVRFDNGREAILPRANVEMIET